MTIKFIFSLEEEAILRTKIKSLLRTEENKEFRWNMGVLTNMAIRDLALINLELEKDNPNSLFTEEEIIANLKEGCPKEYERESKIFKNLSTVITAIKAPFSLDFSFLHFNICYWFDDRYSLVWRDAVEEREMEITGIVSSYNPNYRSKKQRYLDNKYYKEIKIKQLTSERDRSLAIF